MLIVYWFLSLAIHVLLLSYKFLVPSSTMRDWASYEWRLGTELLYGDRAWRRGLADVKALEVCRPSSAAVMGCGARLL
jgi:hypothetical protein